MAKNKSKTNNQIENKELYAFLSQLHKATSQWHGNDGMRPTTSFVWLATAWVRIKSMTINVNTAIENMNSNKLKSVDYR